ncbi:hypothetical protein HELRODRAFT_182433 [Helobdella robusta]|uniref:C-type lectin domain-containing protein n=1 Tax=Helobdella robusta TaxID=6412 RepID=T1FI68_HELRO|nr:hypothetical protein HELRODRAFT_182433 [Helobdella robusta]ESN90960.1 hypothetical protein HELRODRAFT_182433 [Helobdella robusta]
MFTRAYSYLVAKHEKTFVCLNRGVSIPLSIPVESLTGCLVKCLVVAITDGELRGVSYMQSSRSCTCLQKSNLTYQVTAVGSMTAADCRSYVIHECPANFDYVIEYHKCYKMQFKRKTWQDGRTSCNAISSSHPAIFEDDVEYNIAFNYVNHTTPAGKLCPGIYFPNSFTFFIGGYRTYFNGTRTPFYWSPYPGVYHPMQATKAWHKGEPGTPDNGKDCCVQMFLTVYTGLDDEHCFYTLCMLCEVDLQN